MLMTPALARVKSLLRRLRGDRSGVAIIEFALTTPIIVTMGVYGIETTNYALTNLRVSQIALTLADNISRAGADSALSLKKLSESDINEALYAAKLQGASLDLTTQGRIVLSSLERNSSGGQWIHWQRCLGLKHYNSTYGVEGDGATGTSFTGMGPAPQVQAPVDAAVMFVEITYDYQPMIGAAFIGTRQLHYTAAFITRDQRDLTQVYNNAPAATVSACNVYTS
jgi:hypothetical protein